MEPSPKQPSPFEGISVRGVYGRPWKTFAKELLGEIKNDNVSNGAAALGFYFTLAIFPALIFLLSLLPYLPIENLSGQIMGAMHEAMPGDAANMFTSTIEGVVNHRRGGLLSIGAL